MSAFTWWHVVDGMAQAHPDNAATRARIDAFEPGWFGTIEGAILHGGVIATAFSRETVETFDAAQWLATGAMVPAGSITMTKITAQREA